MNLTRIAEDTKRVQKQMHSVMELRQSDNRVRIHSPASHATYSEAIFIHPHLSPFLFNQLPNNNQYMSR